MIASLALGLAVAQQPTRLPQSLDISPVRRHRNIVLVIADDFGVDMVGAYGEGAAPPCTPNIDGLASDGMLFRNAWANPVCTPTRAAVFTGRHGFRTGLGQPGQNSTLPLSELILPEVLAGYESSLVGKWHLAGGQGNASHPNDSGFQHFSGSLGGGLSNYSQWSKTVDGSTFTTTAYATSDTVDDAIVAMAGMAEPWLLCVSFNAPHTPFHVPPASVCGGASCPNTWCGNLPPTPSNRDLGKAMVEAMDAELGRFLVALDAVDPDAYLFFMGDNGTARQLTEAPFSPMRAKGSVYEGGVNVPLIVRGPGVAVAECGALVSCVDLFATIAQLAGTFAATEDSVSMTPYFSDPMLSLRETVYTETFSPNGGSPPFADHRRTIRNVRYKLLRQTGQSDELYDLDLDPFETTNLLPGLTATEQLAYDQLVAELVLLGVG